MGTSLRECAKRDWGTIGESPTTDELRTAGAGCSVVSAQYTPGPIDVDVDLLRALVERLNGQYRASWDTAYCPSSEAHRLQRHRIAETNASLDACFAAIATATGSAA